MKMPLVLRCSAALLLLVLLYSPAEHGSEARPPPCCLRTSQTTVRLDLLEEYKEQKKFICPVHALIFTTKKNIRICSDPASPWAIRAKKYLDKKNQHEEPAHHTTALQTEAQPQINSTTTINQTSVFV